MDDKEFFGQNEVEEQAKPEEQVQAEEQVQPEVQMQAEEQVQAEAQVQPEVQEQPLVQPSYRQLQQMEMQQQPMQQQPMQQQPMQQQPMQQRPMQRQPMQQQPHPQMMPPQYQDFYQPRPQMQPKQQNSENPPQKKGNFFLKILGAIGLAIIFGLVAGITFYGVKFVVDKNQQSNLVAVGSEVPSEEHSEVPSEITSEPTSEEVDPDGTNITVAKVPIIDGASTQDVSGVVKAVMPSMVSVNTTADYTYYGVTQEGESSGSGFIVGMNETELLIATNYHVIEGGKKIEIQFVDTTKALAEVKGKNIPMDVAVIAVKMDELSLDTKKAISISQLGNSEELQVGQPAIAIGNALGYGQSVTTGVISALNREQTLSDGSTGYFIQTDAAINPGNSGGALLNMNGQVIGINSSKLGGSVVEGMGYAIPISIAQPIISELATKQELASVPEDQQSYLGISGVNVSNASNGVTPTGVYVAEVYADSPAEAAGIMKGDIITEFEGDSMADMDDLKRYLAAYSAGTTVEITVMRDVSGQGSYKKLEVEVTLAHAS